MPPDLQRTLRAVLKQRGVSAGKTWGDFQDAMLSLGIRDSDTLAGIEFGFGRDLSGRIVADREEDGVVIREVK